MTTSKIKVFNGARSNNTMEITSRGPLTISPNINLDKVNYHHLWNTQPTYVFTYDDQTLEELKEESECVLSELHNYEEWKHLGEMTTKEEVFNLLEEMNVYAKSIEEPPTLWDKLNSTSGFTYNSNSQPRGQAIYGLQDFNGPMDIYSDLLACVAYFTNQEQVHKEVTSLAKLNKLVGTMCEEGYPLGGGEDNQAYYLHLFLCLEAKTREEEEFNKIYLKDLEEVDEYGGDLLNYKKLKYEPFYYSWRGLYVCEWLEEMGALDSFYHPNN